MKKTLLPLVFCFLWLGAKGQNCEPSFDCTTAPILCGADLDGLQATTVLNSPTISIPPNFAFFCQNSVIDNNQWIGFSPCTPSVNLLIQVNGCAMGNGLQAVIFESGDCQDFVAVSNCLTEITPFTTGVLTADNLVPGNVYYLMIDGFIGDACDYEVSVLSGVDTATPVFGAAMPGHVQGPSVVGCGTPFGNVANYTVLGPSCENTGGSTCPGGVYITPDDFCIFYNWTLPQGAVIIDNSPNFDEVTIDFSNAVSGLITVTSEFDDQCGCHCGYCPTSLGILPFFVQVNQPSVQVLPPLTLCEGDAFFFCGQTYQLGTNGSTFQCTNGCDVQMQEVFVEACPGNCPQHNQPVAPADSCHTAPPFCASYLNGYCSTNGGYTPDLPGNLASTIPCTLENNQWLKFNACSTEVQIELAVSNCLASNGLEFFILQTTDCQIFAAQAACFTIASGGTGTLEATNLSPGETYYLMVDGLAGDVCDWQVLSTLGISEGAVYQAVNTPGQVVTVDPAQEEVCGGATVAFTFEPAICQDLQLVSGCPAEQQFCAPFMDTCVVVVRYDTVWHVTPYGWGAVFVDNDSIGSFANVIYPSFPPLSQAGADSLIFTTSVEFIAVELDTVLCWNSCVAECSTILSATEPCTIRPKEIKVCFPKNTNEYFAICPGECITSMGETFCSPGTFTIESIGPCGCINTHVVTIEMFLDSPPFVGPPTYDCSPDGSSYTVSFSVSSSNGFVVTVNGMPVNGIFTSAPIPSGNSFSFLVEQYNICGSSFPIFVAGSHTCQPCTGVTNDLGTIQLCPGDCYSLQGNSYCNPGSYTEQLLNPATNCLDTYIFTLAQIIENQLLVGVQTEICDASSQYYSVGFPIVDGTPPYAVNGNPVSGNFYQSGLIPSGQPYAFTVTDAASCAPQQVNIAGVFDCACINDPGTAQLITLYGCEGEMVSVEFNNDAVAGTGDLHVFILHSGTITSLGNIVGMNTTGTFGFVPGAMSFGQTYHISPAVGPDLGGTVDMTAACFQFGPGQPVVFYRQPAAQILEPDTLTCVVNSLMLNGLAADGSGVFDYHWDGPGSYSASVPNPMVGQPGPYALT
ncbi:MAG: hypothetical protein MUC59_10735, partial [Saprospiraceae bacterium]|nr:hypothetical protein [Saprospiraceae bacterium]